MRLRLRLRFARRRPRSSPIIVPSTLPPIATVAIRVNGETREIPTGWTLSHLLADLAIDPRLIVVERNREIIRDRTAFDEVTLQDRDILELVHFVGGG
mgnify:FL=1